MNTSLRIGRPYRLPALLLFALCVAIFFSRYTVFAAANAGEHAEDHVDEERLTLTSEQVRYAEITIEHAGPATLRETLPLYGQVVPNAEREHAVSARYPGLIRQVTKRTGDAVQQGEVLAMVESNESLKPYPIVASLAGVVVQRRANVGEQTGDRTLFVIGDYATVWVNLSVFPGDLANIHRGQTVQITSTDAATTGEGIIIAVSPTGNSANQSTTATVELDNSDRRWVPGHFVNAEVVVSQSAVPIAIREEAVQFVDDQHVVFVAENESFAVRPVELGRSDGRFSEVLAGLRAGESYVSGNSFILKSELGKEGAEHGH